MSKQKSNSFLFIIFSFLVFLSINNCTIAGYESVCKVTFCNCCEGLFNYYVYDKNGQVVGTFVTDPTVGGCSGVNAFNGIPGNLYYVINQDCDDAPIVYFTACICALEDPNRWTDTVMLPCCTDTKDKHGTFGRDNNVNVLKDFVLLQNYPNPFNPVTVIKFSIPFETNVKIAIYDASGKEVETLLNDITTPGFHEVTWNASNVASGIYFYKLISGNFTAEKKMVVLK